MLLCLYTFFIKINKNIPGMPQSVNYCIYREIHKKKIYAEVIRANVKSEITRFFSSPKSSFQFGFVAGKQ